MLWRVSSAVRYSARQLSIQRAHLTAMCRWWQQEVDIVTCRDARLGTRQHDWANSFTSEQGTVVVCTGTGLQLGVSIPVAGVSLAVGNILGWDGPVCTAHIPLAFAARRTHADSAWPA